MSDSKIKVFDVVNDKFVPLPVSSGSSLTVTDTTLDDEIYLQVGCRSFYLTLRRKDAKEEIRCHHL
jgi:hypothetical protein